jgi:hypothetical protein
MYYTSLIVDARKPLESVCVELQESSAGIGSPQLSLSNSTLSTKR